MDPKKVLIASSDEKTGLALKANFEKQGWATQVQKDTAQIVTNTQAFKPNAIIIDIANPEFGCHATNQLKELPKLKNIPILFLSPFARKQEEEIYCGLVDGSPFTASPSFPSSTKVKDLIKMIEKYLMPPERAPSV